jgi:Putative capsular polysaccharide synthesis protein
MQSVARRLVGQSYTASKQLALWRMRRTEPPLVVFSMGKTGSTAIARALHDATGDPVFQVFRLEPVRLAQAEQRYRAAQPRRSFGGASFPGARHLWESAYLLRQPPRADAPWTVVTTVREPVAQAVSAFFHGRGRRPQTGGVQDVTQLVAELVAGDWVRPPLRWFDREFAPALGVDVYGHAFDPAVGHAVIETPALRVLLLRQENFASAPAALARFLGRPDPVPVPPRNEASTKGYGPRYAEFVAAARLPDDVLHKAYSSRYARHFYADSEREAFRRRWSGGSAGSAGSV